MQTPMPITTAVFDAYGTLFDVAGAARLAAEAPDGAALRQVWPHLAAEWRRKQLEYSWLRAITGDHAPFDDVTADSLDWAMAAQGLDDPALRARLLALYDHLPAYPEVPATLRALHTKGITCAILSNGTPAMLRTATTTAGIADAFAAVLSVETVGVYKPHRAVYAMVETALGVAPSQVAFVSSNGWDIAGAAGFGFRTAWINRAGVPVDRLPHRPTTVLPDLSEVPPWIAA